jgi:hypothetical protein
MAAQAPAWVQVMVAAAETADPVVLTLTDR